MMDYRETDEEFMLSQFTSRISVATNEVVQSCPSFPAKNGRSSPADSGYSSCKATQEEAQLLMNLLSPVPKRKAVQEGFPRSPVMSPFSRFDPYSSHTVRPLSMENSAVFDFTCPSLSLACSDFLHPLFSTTTYSSAKSRNSFESNVVPPSPSVVAPARGNPNTPTRMSKVMRNDREIPHLPKLLEREITNPVKTWKDVSPKAENLAENIKATFEFVVDSRIQTWMESIARVLRLQEQAKAMNLQNGENSNVHQDDESKKKVLEALSRVSSKISVSKVTTNFRTLGQRVPSPNQYGRPSSAVVSPPPKKRSKIDTEFSQGFDMKRPIEFAATIDIAPFDLTLTLYSPGTIKGSFETSPSEPNRVNRLRAVDLQLDMEALVHSLRKKSRYVARKAAESELFSTAEDSLQNFKDSSSKLPTQSSCDVKCMVSKENNGKNNNNNCTMPPPPPRNSTKLLGIVSPSPGSPNQINPKQPAQNFNQHGTSKLPESIIAPFVKKSLEVSESDSHKMSKHQKGNPSLPALVEVACASFAAEHCMTDPSV